MSRAESDDQWRGISVMTCIGEGFGGDAGKAAGVRVRAEMASRR